MIDIIIITAYVAVVLKIVLKVFQWFEDRFHVYGKRADVVEEINKEGVASAIGEEDVMSGEKDEGKKQMKSPSKEIEEPVAPVKGQQIFEHVPITLDNVLTQSQEKKTTQSEKVENQLQPQPQQIVEQQAPSQLIQTSNIQATEPQRTFTTPVIEINLPPQDQYTSQALIHENQQLRDMIEQSQKLRQKEINQFNQHIEKLKNDKNKYSEKLIGAVQDYQSEKEQNKLLAAQIQELTSTFGEKIQNIKGRYQSQISVLKQKLIEQEERLSKQESGLSTTQPSIEVLTMKSKLEQMKHQLEFSQSQLQQAYESEAKMKDEIEKLRAESEFMLAEIQKLKKQSSKVKPRPQISISDIINHPEYVRVKEKLQRYESGSMGNSGIKSVIQRTEFTPQGERVSKGLDSRISERRSFIPSKYNAESTICGEEEVFSECNFLTPQNKHFLLDEIKKIKKLPIKKTKLLFKLDKLHPANPHENIDNIPNIVLLVELTNKKILGAFTQTAFNKEETSLIGEKSLISRSRHGTNKSLIVDLTNKVSLSNTKTSETIIYDENAIVWGKDELIIKNDEPTILYSSFGTQEGVYWDGKYTLEELLGGSQGFERINQYEFYRIYIG